MYNWHTNLIIISKFETISGRCDGRDLIRTDWLNKAWQHRLMLIIVIHILHTQLIVCGLAVPAVVCTICKQTNRSGSHRLDRCQKCQVTTRYADAFVLPPFCDPLSKSRVLIEQWLNRHGTSDESSEKTLTWHLKGHRVTPVTASVL